jgi:hypothetical protein
MCTVLAAHLNPRPHGAVNRATERNTQGRVAASDRFAVFLCGPVINWQLAKGTGCERDGSTGDEGRHDGSRRRSFSGPCEKKGADVSSRPH